METWTIKKLLEWVTPFFTSKGIDAPRLSAEMLLSHVLKLARIELYVQFDRVVSAEQLATLRGLVKRAAEHEPIAYLIGRTEFYSLTIEVGPDVLIPRPETEMLVERAIDDLRVCGATPTLLDMCTGSGCVAVAVAKNVHDVHVTATDISTAALTVARANVQQHGLTERVDLKKGDLFSPVADMLGRFDVIVSNPPYVTTAEMKRLDANVKDYEPDTALHGGDDGLEVIRRIVGQAPRFLKPGGVLLMEIGHVHGAPVSQLLAADGAYSDIHIEKDPAGHDRIARARRTIR